jgi:hypothetical protein
MVMAYGQDADQEMEGMEAQSGMTADDAMGMQAGSGMGMSRTMKCPKCGYDMQDDGTGTGMMNCPSCGTSLHVADASKMQPKKKPSWDDVPDVDPAREELIHQWEDKIKDGKKHWEKFFKRTRECEQLAFAGADKDWVLADSYTVPVIPRHINQSVAVLYAKDPRVTAKPRDKLMYQLWDGTTDQIEGIVHKIMLQQQMASMGQMVPGPDPNDMAVLEEIKTVSQHEQMVEKLGKTLEILWDYYTKEQATNFKSQMKALVRRAKVAGVAYCQLGYQRILEPNPDVSAKIQDVTSKIKSVESTLDKLGDDQIHDGNAELEQLRLNLKDLQDQEMMVVREGPIFSWPKVRDIIIDPDVTHVKTLEGAAWYAREYLLTPERVFEIYGVRIGNNYTKRYRVDDDGKQKRNRKESEVCVYEVFDERNRQQFVIAEGYCDFVSEPQEPSVKIERFWNLFPLVFNEVENEEEKFPPSDVWLMRHPQKDVNRARQGLREHRNANRPKYITSSSALEEDDKRKIAQSEAHAIIELQGLQPGEDVAKKIQKFDHTGIDPNQYQVEEHHKDILRSVGSSEAAMGTPSGGTATENSIAESARSASQADNVDELDDFLTELAKATGHLMMLELEKPTVIEIVGPGAIWPDMRPTREMIAKDLDLEIEAGSSGRPNKAAELANLERAAPYVLQIPGVSPKPLAKKYADLLDIKIEDLYKAGLPSIAAQNQPQMGPPGGGPGGGQGAQSDPNAQGAKGGDNKPKPGPQQPGPQPAYPPPGGGGGMPMQ